MQVGDSYFMEDMRGVRVLILKDSLNESLVEAMVEQRTTRVVVRRFCRWKKTDLKMAVREVRELWIEDAEAPAELAELFPDVVSLHLARALRGAFFKSFPKLEECRLDRLTELPTEIASIRGLKSLTLGDGCRLAGETDFSVLCGLEKLVLSATSLPKGFAAFGALKNLRYLGMSQWKGTDLQFLAGLTGLRECVFSYFAKATSLSGIAVAAKLERLHLSTWSRLTNVDELARLTALKVLILEDCSAIQSLKSLAGHPAVEELILWGRTDVKDGRLKVVSMTPRLSRFQFNNRKHYDLKPAK